MFKPFGRVIAAFLLCTALANVTWAQGTRATISGVVQDPTGAAIPAVELSLRSLATSAVVKASSGADGFYTFPGLVAGFFVCYLGLAYSGECLNGGRAETQLD